MTFREEHVAIFSAHTGRSVDTMFKKATKTETKCCRKSTSELLSPTTNYINIQLDRVNLDNTKIDTNVKIEKELHFECWKSETSNEFSREAFEMVGVTCHTGTPQQGHYYMLAKQKNGIV